MPRLLVTNWHEPWVASLCQIGFDFDILELPVIGLQRIDGDGRWGTMPRELPANARLVSDRETLLANLRQGVYDAVVCLTVFDLQVFTDPAIPKIFCPISSPANDCGLDPAAQQRYRDTARHFLGPYPTAYMTAQIGKPEMGGFDLPGRQVSLGTVLDPTFYDGYAGDRPTVLRVANHLAKRWFLNLPLQRQVLADLPHVIVGHNPDLPDSLPSMGTDELLEQYRHCRMFFNSIHPDITEGSTPTTVIEAMLVGMPIITTPHPTSIIEDGVHGFVAADVPTLQARIRQLLDDRDLAVRLGQQGRRLAIRLYGDVVGYRQAWAALIHEAQGIRRRLTGPARLVADLPLELGTLIVRSGPGEPSDDWGEAIVHAWDGSLPPGVWQTIVVDGIGAGLPAAAAEAILAQIMRQLAFGGRCRLEGHGASGWSATEAVRAVIAAGLEVTDQRTNPLAPHVWQITARLSVPSPLPIDGLPPFCLAAPMVGDAGWQDALAAFFRAFVGRPHVGLLLPFASQTQDQAVADVEAALAALGIDADQGPDIVLTPLAGPHQQAALLLAAQGLITSDPQALLLAARLQRPTYPPDVAALAEVAASARV